MGVAWSLFWGLALVLASQEQFIPPPLTYSAKPVGGLMVLGASEVATGEQSPPLILSIAEPANGATVPAGPLLVRGSLQTRDVGIEVGVTVNGVAASTQGNTFAALVPMIPEITSLTAVGTTAAGDTASQTIALTVTPTPEPAFTMRVSPVIGVAPLTVIFSILGGPVPASIALDLEGDGTPEFTGPTLEGQTFSYPTPGLYLPTVTVTDARGTQHTATAGVQVYDRTTLDSLLQAKWTAMKDALRGGDIERALTLITVRRRDIARKMLTALTPQQQAAIDQILTNVSFVHQRGLTVEYEMRRLDDGIEISHLILFTRDEDGIWRIRFF